MTPTTVRTAKEIGDMLAAGLPVHRPDDGQKARTAREITEYLLSGGKLYSGQQSPVWYSRFTAADQRGLDVLHFMAHWIAAEPTRSKAFIEAVRQQLDGK